MWTHIPVLAREIKDLLITDVNGRYMDGTLGLGGHSKYLLSFLGADAKMFGYDKDASAIKMAVANVADFRLVTFNKSYVSAEEKVCGALFDLGLSSYQLDDASRGFSFMRTGPLDMRFDPAGGMSAEEVVNSLPADDLEKIFVEFGEERNAFKIAHAIAASRRAARITDTLQLAKIIESASPRHGKTHPATNVFQALRIYVNGEFDAVKAIGKTLERVLTRGGRAAAITFHSLEDRIIKNIFKDLAESGGWELVNKKVIVPSRGEILQNPRARSAKLRVIERL